MRCPSSVSDSARVERRNSDVRNSNSRSASLRLTVDLGRPSAMAAAVKLPSSAMATSSARSSREGFIVLKMERFHSKCKSYRDSGGGVYPASTQPGDHAMIHFSSVYTPTQMRHGAAFSARQYPRQAFDNLIDPVLNVDRFEMSGPTFPPHPHAGS